MYFSDVIWEADCAYEEATVKEYAEWVTQSQSETSTQNPLTKYDPEAHWCYAGYTYMGQKFQDFPQMLEVSVQFVKLSLQQNNSFQFVGCLQLNAMRCICFL